ncbi:MAG: hypothetical protein ABIR58_09135 [Gemmatimonadaceae bacterium]
MDIHYRLFEDNDLAAVRKLWEDNTAWGALPAETWHRHMVESPLGPGGGVLAIDGASGEIVGQFAFCRRSCRSQIVRCAHSVRRHRSSPSECGSAPPTRSSTPSPVCTSMPWKPYEHVATG